MSEIKILCWTWAQAGCYFESFGIDDLPGLMGLVKANPESYCQVVHLAEDNRLNKYLGYSSIDVFVIWVGDPEATTEDLIVALNADEFIDVFYSE